MQIQRWMTATAVALTATTAASSAQAVNYGVSCPGESGTTPTIGLTGFPTLGQSFDIDITGAPTTAGLMLLGTTQLAPGFDLTSFGLPGCELALIQNTTIPFATDGTGAFSFTNLSPFSLPGATVYLQAYVADLGVSTIGGTTDGLAVTSIAPTGNVGGELVITEFMKDPNFVTDNDGEYIEIFNSTGSAIDIEGWILSDNDFDSTTLDNGGSGIFVGAGAYLVLGTNADTGTNGGVIVGAEYGVNGQYFLSNSADEIILTDISGVEIDRIEYDNGVLWAEAAGESLELAAGSTDATSNDDPANWSLSTCTIEGAPCNPDFGTPGSANDTCSTSPCVTTGSGELIFSEIMQNPSAVADASGEWFEVYNTTGSDIDMMGYTITAGGSPSSEVISSSVIVPAGGYALFSRLSDPLLNGGLPAPAYDYDDGLNFSNGTQTCRINDAGGGLVSEITYDNGATYPDGNGASMQLDPDFLDASGAADGNNWCLGVSAYGDGDLGTPGTANEECP